MNGWKSRLRRPAANCEMMGRTGLDASFPMPRIRNEYSACTQAGRQAWLISYVYILIIVTYDATQSDEVLADEDEDGHEDERGMAGVGETW